MSPNPERALRSADGLRTLVPGAGHLNHMPTHIDAQCGVAGDMLLAALIDLGGGLDEVVSTLNTFDLELPAIAVETVSRSGIRALHLRVDVVEEEPV